MAYAKADAPVALQYPCEGCPLRGCSAFREFSEDELAFMSRFKRGELVAAAGTLIFEEGAEGAHLYTVLAGWGMRHKSLADGRRQIVNFVLPGDFIGLQASLGGAMDHSVEALTDVLLCVFERDRFYELFDVCPSLAYDLIWIAAREHQLLDSNLLSVGRRTALERMAYLILLLYLRAEARGLAKDGQVSLPFTQQHMADALGMSLVHTNKTLARLRGRGLVNWNRNSFQIGDQERLAALAKWEPDLPRPRPFL
jgi:CRP/FNR family transcriptional regulator, anaerobic regulatory protein